MNQKQSAESQIFQTKDKQDKQLTETEYKWTDDELYPKPSQDLSCCQRFKIGLSNFGNRALDFFEFDRVFVIQGDQIIDIKRCHKKFLQDYEQTYSQRQLRFGYTFDFVLNQKLKEEKRKEKTFLEQLYRLVCCEGGNQMKEVDQAYKSQRQFQQLLKKKIMQRRQQYDQERRKEEQKRRKQQQGLRFTTQNQILEKQPEQAVPQDILIQSLEYYDEDVEQRKEKRKKQAQRKVLNMEVLEIKPSQNAGQDVQDNVFNYQSKYIQQKITGRGKKERKQPIKPDNYPSQNTSQQDLSEPPTKQVKMNQIVRLQATANSFTQKSNQAEQNNERKSNQLTKIYKENLIITTTQHENIINKQTVYNQDDIIQQTSNPFYQDSEKPNKKVRKSKQKTIEETHQAQQNDQLKISRKINGVYHTQSACLPQSIPDQNIELQKSSKVDSQSLFLASPNTVDKEQTKQKSYLNINQLEDQEEQQRKSKRKMTRMQKQIYNTTNNQTEYQRTTQTQTQKQLKINRRSQEVIKTKSIENHENIKKQPQYQNAMDPVSMKRNFQPKYDEKDDYRPNQIQKSIQDTGDVAKNQKTSNQKGRVQQHQRIQILSFVQPIENSAFKKKPKRIHSIQQQSQNYAYESVKNPTLVPQKDVIGEANLYFDQQQKSDQLKMAKPKKQKRNRKNSDSNLQIIETVFQTQHQPEFINKTSFALKNESTQPHNNNDQQFLTSKKKRKQKRQPKNDDLQQTSQIDVQNLGSSASTAPNSINQTNLHNLGDFYEESQVQQLRIAKRRKAKRQLKEHPSQQKFQMVFIDQEQHSKQHKQKSTEDMGRSIVLMDADEEPESKLKAEKKRKKPKPKKQAADQGFEQVVDLDL